MIQAVGPFTTPPSAAAQTDVQAWIVRAAAAWTPAPGWQDVSSPALLALGIHRVIPPSGEAAERLLAVDPRVVSSTPERNVESLDNVVTPNDAGWPLQYAPEQIQAPQAWQVAAGCALSVLAVIDSGLDFSHPDMAGRTWTNPGETGAGRETNRIDDDGNGYVDDWRGWDFVNKDNQPSDDYGHGTHVAGIANAAANNGIGIAGVAGATWGVQIMALKVLDGSGIGTDSQAAEAIKYAVDNGARVINLSLGDPLPTPAIERALEYAAAHAVLVVAASGNSGIYGVYYPARYDTALAVGAVTPDNERAYFSSFGPELDLMAPGVAIYSTVPGGNYSYRSGTSMAAPHIAAVAALLARMPQYNTASLIRDALVNTALVVAPDESSDLYGYGLVQARDALDWDPNGEVATCHLAYLPSIGNR